MTKKLKKITMNDVIINILSGLATITLGIIVFSWVGLIVLFSVVFESILFLLNWDLPKDW